MSIDEPISRRDFLKIVAGTGAIVGLGAGFGGLLAACDEPSVASNTTATIPPSQTTTSTTTAPTTTTTTVQTGPEAGRPLRLGVVSAKTGALALFGKADDWWTGLAAETVRDGIVGGDGKVRAVRFHVVDCRSDASAAAGLATRLISDERVDLIMCSGDSDIVNGVADRAEALGCPCLADFVSWQAFVYGRGGTLDRPFKWTYAHAFGLEDVAANYLAAWGRMQTNKKLGLVIADDTDGRLWGDAASGLPAAAAEAGYETIMPGLYPRQDDPDFTPYISEFTKNGCEICCCVMSTTDFAVFWSQAAQQDYQPRIVTVGKGLLFPQALEAAGSAAQGLTAECLWQPSWPYRDSLTGKTAQELADDYQSKTGEQWTVAIAQYAKFEWAVQAFKKAAGIVDKEDVIARVRTAKLDTCCGPLDLTASVGSGDPAKTERPSRNVYKTPLGCVQWRAGDVFAFEPALVANVNSPALIVTRPVDPMAYP